MVAVSKVTKRGSSLYFTFGNKRRNRMFIVRMREDLTFTLIRVVSEECEVFNAKHWLSLTQIYKLMSLVFGGIKEIEVVGRFDIFTDRYKIVFDD